MYSLTFRMRVMLP